MVKDCFKKELSLVLFDEEMKKHTSFKTGGPADIFVDCGSRLEVIRATELANEFNLPYMIVGNGSNLLVSDLGIEGVVIHIGSRMNNIEVNGNIITAEAGALLSRTANEALKHSLTGLEFAAGIPGSLGGGIYMNAGAYDGELKNVIKSVTYLDNGEIKTKSGEELNFSYRHSMFSGKNYVILSADIELKVGDKAEIKAKMLDLNKRRSDKQPLEYPSAGSTFKRPEGYFAGKLIQDSGLMGYSVGGAQVSEKHAGFVINKDNATSADVLKLIEHIKKTVFDNFGVMLEPEVRLVGRSC